MIGQVPISSASPPQFRIQAARAPIVRVGRQVDLIGAKPNRQVRELTPLGQMGTRIDVRA